MTRVKLELKNRDVISNQELVEMLSKSQTNRIEYFKVRDSCIIALLRLTGKRREEVAILPMENVWVAENLISIRFFLVKKWRNMKKPDGTKIRVRNPDNIALKKIQVSNPLAKYILEYISWMKDKYPNSKFFFPSSFYSGLTGQINIDIGRHLSGSQILRIVKKYNPNAWCHLFRDTVGADIAKSDPSLMSVFRIKQRLDHVSEQTAWKYLRRYAGEIVGEEIIS